MTSPHIAHPGHDAPSSAPNDSLARDTVVSLYNDQDLARALAPWKSHGRKQRWVKARLILSDLSILWCCLIIGRLPLVYSKELTLMDALNVWWADQGHIRIALFAGMALQLVRQHVELIRVIGKEIDLVERRLRIAAHVFDGLIDHGPRDLGRFATARACTCAIPATAARR